MDAEEIKSIIDERIDGYGGILAILEEIQSRSRYLSREVLGIVAQETGRSLPDLYGIARFYKRFRLTPHGRHVITICTCEECHVRGALDIVYKARELLGIDTGETTPDGEFSLDTINCQGECTGAPTVFVDRSMYQEAHPSDMYVIIARCRDQAAGEDDRRSSGRAGCSRCNHVHEGRGVPLDLRSFMCLAGSSSGHPPSIRESGAHGIRGHELQHEIPTGKGLQFLCSRCHAGISRAPRCSVCGTPMASLNVMGMGNVNVCTRNECPGHVLHAG